MITIYFTTVIFDKIDSLSCTGQKCDISPRIQKILEHSFCVQSICSINLHPNSNGSPATLLSAIVRVSSHKSGTGCLVRSRQLAVEYLGTRNYEREVSKHLSIRVQAFSKRQHIHTVKHTEQQQQRQQQQHGELFGLAFN